MYLYAWLIKSNVHCIGLSPILVVKLCVGIGGTMYLLPGLPYQLFPRAMLLLNGFDRHCKLNFS